ncbi:hypothetical protein PP175_28790 (plasmid) [Aneurinibacillus sp. Ricciae_BoGa-3]|uniref:hypothetical protein n=1 Tax=Aneurinibacillus sp. Ricciae_BoGa-3 TaxID=3022697 RepID=UPI00233FC39C|nr:hypothetical protein [Aneurinibacillus sp. Ricciae_BoGa-3]WCK57188.1 hypothetical protein PP175_28790 [Aneurinibacillus sp. Ricciae_BoGa-3]
MKTKTKTIASAIIALSTMIGLGVNASAMSFPQPPQPPTAPHFNYGMPPGMYQPPFFHPPVYQPPVFHPPIYQQTVYQPPSFHPPVYQTPVNTQVFKSGHLLFGGFGFNTTTHMFQPKLYLVASDGKYELNMINMASMLNLSSADMFNPSAIMSKFPHSLTVQVQGVLQSNQSITVNSISYLHTPNFPVAPSAPIAHK